MANINLKQYFTNELGWGWGHQQELIYNFLQNVAAFCENGVILDVGAGHQRYKPFFSKSTYIAQEHPESGQKNKQLKNFDILCDAKNIPLKNESVDGVLSTSSLEHMEFPELFFEEAHRVLKPGGKLFINVPFIHPEHEIPFDFQRPTRYGLRRWYEHSGFVNTEVKPTSSSIYSATCFIKMSVVEGKLDIRTALDSKEYLKAIKLSPNYFLYFLVIRPFIFILNFLYDSPPGDHTKFPIGWIAVGTKSGEFKLAANARKLSNLDFLQSNIIESKNFILHNGSIKYSANE
jgi:SAM-dependent methyltransferase